MGRRNSFFWCEDEHRNPISHPDSGVCRRGSPAGRVSVWPQASFLVGAGDPSDSAGIPPWITGFCEYRRFRYHRVCCCHGSAAALGSCKSNMALLPPRTISRSLTCEARAAARLVGYLEAKVASIGSMHDNQRGGFLSPSNRHCSPSSFRRTAPKQRSLWSQRRGARAGYFGESSPVRHSRWTSTICTCFSSTW